MAAYRAPVARAEAEIREKGSVFLARLAPAGREEDARAFLAEVSREHPDATHHCWAWRLGPQPHERSSDAGEPGGTAGVPMLQVLRGAGLADVVVVVVRWYGGTNLGKGGLARAYAGAVRAAVADIATEQRVPTVSLTLEVPYEKIGAVKRLIHPPKVELRSESYGATARLVLTVWETEAATLEAALGDLALTPDVSRE
ncbi:MAG: YigZ family protein [Thermoanaerobaculia bacterium]|nr:YigZ family protein [Thermoanaerobaculia bacterium]